MAGDLVGLQGAFDEPSTHSVEALLASRLCVFHRPKFENLIAKHPRLGYDVIWMAAEEESALEEHLVALGRRSAKERVAYLAVFLMDRAKGVDMAGDDNRLALPIRQAQIADMLGLSLVHMLWSQPGQKTLTKRPHSGPVLVHVKDTSAACSA